MERTEHLASQKRHNNLKDYTLIKGHYLMFSFGVGWGGGYGGVAKKCPGLFVIQSSLTEHYRIGKNNIVEDHRFT